jgi:hypothetical protein
MRNMDPTRQLVRSLHARMVEEVYLHQQRQPY